MSGLKLDISNVYPFVPEESILGQQEQVHNKISLPE